MIGKMKNRGEGIGKIDIGLAVVASIVGLYLMYENVYVGIDDFDIQAGFLALPFFLAVTVPVAWRRAAPLAAMSVAVVALVGHILVFGEMVRCGVAFPVLLLLAFSVGSRLELRESLLGMAIGFGGIAAVCVDDPILTSEGDSAASVFLFIGVIALVVWGTGRAVHSRGRLTERLRTRTTELQAARDERAGLEVASDRARLASELDELLQRRLGELAQLADQGAASADVESSSAALVEIENQSRRTLEEMRAIVGVLRSETADAQTAPMPTLTSLEALLVRAKGSGAAMAVEGSPRTLPAGVELSAYRIVEHLLAALEDSDDVDVTVRFGDEALELRVSGPSRRRPEAAIERARARAQLHQGTVETAIKGKRASATALLPVSAVG